MRTGASSCKPSSRTCHSRIRWSRSHTRELNSTPCIAPRTLPICHMSFPFQVLRPLSGDPLPEDTFNIRGASGMPFAALLIAVTRKRKKTPTSLRGCIETDPLGVLSHEGRLPQTLGQAYDEMAMLTQWAVVHAPQLQTICVHSRAWHEAGA